MKKMKENHVKKINKTTLIIFIVIIIALTTVVVQAYFTARFTKTNNINLGYNKIELLEDYKPPLTIEKNSTFKKEPYVRNTGDVECYVRMKSVVSDSRTKVNLNYNKDEFEYNEDDGYWYYKKALGPGDETPRLFTTVTIPEDADDIVLEGFDIYVYAESVQTVDNMTMDQVWQRFSKETSEGGGE